MPPETAEVKRWLEKAGRDRRAAEGALAQHPPMTDIAAFHCQWCRQVLLRSSCPT